MGAMNATVLRLSVAILSAFAPACRKPPRATAPPQDAGTVVTVYVPPQAIDRLISRLTTVAASHHWALSVRTDPGALGDADLVILDSGGALLGRVRPESAAAAQAQRLWAAVLR